MGTWTFMCHWNDSDELVLDYHVEGDVDDERVDTGQWQGGLFAAAASGRTPEEAWKKVKAEYESEAY